MQEYPFSKTGVKNHKLTMGVIQLPDLGRPVLQFHPTYHIPTSVIASLKTVHFQFLPSSSFLWFSMLQTEMYHYREGVDSHRKVQFQKVAESSQDAPQGAHSRWGLNADLDAIKLQKTNSFQFKIKKRTRKPSHRNPFPQRLLSRKRKPELGF
jgi:hypothetical protein